MRVRGSGSESGSVLLWVMVVGLFAVGALGAATRLIPAGTRFTAQDADTTYALIAAESGIHYVTHYLEKHGPEALEALAGEWSVPGEFGGRFRVASDGEHVYVTGEFGNATRTLRARLNHRSDTIPVRLDVAVFAVADTSSPSERAVYMQGSPIIEGSAGTNAHQDDAFYLDWTSTVNSTIFVGPGGGDSTVYRPAWMAFSSRIEVLPEKRDYPLPEPPQFPVELPFKGDIPSSGRDGRTAITVRESGSYGTIQVSDNGSGVTNLYFDTSAEDLYVKVDKLNLDNNGSITVNGPGRVYLHVTDELNLIGREFNVSYQRRNHATYYDPYQVIIYYTGTKNLRWFNDLKLSSVLYVDRANIEIGGSTGFRGDIISGGSAVKIEGGADAWSDRGVIYAPNAHVEISGGAQINGAIVARRFTMTGGTTVTYAAPDLTDWPLRFDDVDDSDGRLEWQICWNNCPSETQPAN